MDSILDTVKHSLDIDVEDTAFDTSIIMHINSVSMDLAHLGIGPADGFVIQDASAKWTDYIQLELLNKLQYVQTYMYLRVKLLFDPPGSASILASYEKQVEKAEWRLNEIMESISSREEENQNG